jgi:acyl-CoA reductase-like NAD-dependent aldehyde dehydrogenase
LGRLQCTVSTFPAANSESACQTCITAGRHIVTEGIAPAYIDGLVNSVLTADLFRGGELARRLRAGMVHVNDATPQDEASAPFGGIGQSGLGGRSGGDANLEKFTERRWLTLNPGPVHLPLLGSSPTKVRRLRDCRPSG